MFSACINSRLLSASPFRLKCSAFRWQAGGTRRCLSSLRYRVSKGAGTVVGSDVAGPPRRLISMSSGDHAALMKEAAQLVPPLSPESHKGSHGKVAVVGGSREYTGAPYCTSCKHATRPAPQSRGPASVGRARFPARHLDVVRLLLVASLLRSRTAFLFAAAAQLRRSPPYGSART